MDVRYTYLLVDFFCIIIPLVFSFHPGIRFYKELRFFVLPCIVAALFFVVWDILFTKMGIWQFNPNRVVGIYLGGLPLEEYLFFICIPYSSVFTWFCFTKFFDFDKYQTSGRIVTRILVITLTVVAIVYPGRLYTSVTFLFLALCLSWLLVRKVTFLPSFLISFLVLLIPFFISNGILTGSMISEPVVLYNSDFNLGIRMFTIPVEDTFYGMLLILMNVAGFSYLRKRSTRVKVVNEY